MGKLLWAGLVMAVLLSGCTQKSEQPSVQSDGKVFRDNFSGGKPELKWSPYPYFFLDNLEGARDTGAPDGDGGIGVLRNANAGGFASLSYAVTDEAGNFYLESMVYCPVTEKEKGPLTGIAFLIDPEKGSFYRFVCDFKASNSTLNVAYVGQDTSNFPVYLRHWGSGEIPGGVPKEGGWHRMAVRVKNGEAAAYWDGNELRGGPITADKNPRGFPGVYTNYVGGLGDATAKVDDFTLRLE